MAKQRKPRPWQAPFLRALARSGNVRVAAREAGVDRSSAYTRRKSDPVFAARWGRAVEKAGAKIAAEVARPGSGQAGRRMRIKWEGGGKPKPGAELVLRPSKAGAKWVKAGPGRWNAKAEKIFLATLARTGNVRRATDAAGFSATALYYRKENFPGFAADWRAAEAAAARLVPEFLVAATIASFDPDIARQDEAAGPLPKVSVAEAIAIAKLKGWGVGGAGGRSRDVPEEPSIEAVRDEILRRLAAIRQHRVRRGGEASSGAPSTIAFGDGPPPRPGEDL